MLKASAKIKMYFPRCLPSGCSASSSLKFATRATSSQYQLTGTRKSVSRTQQIQEELKSSRLTLFFGIFDKAAVMKPLECLRPLDQVSGTFCALLELVAIHDGLSSKYCMGCKKGYLV